MENKFDLAYDDLDDLNDSILDIIENDELFTQDDIMNVIETYIHKINEIITPTEKKNETNLFIFI